MPGKYSTLPAFVTEIPEVRKVKGGMKIAHEVWNNAGKPAEADETAPLLIQRIRDRIRNELQSGRRNKGKSYGSVGNHIFRRESEETY